MTLDAAEGGPEEFYAAAGVYYYTVAPGMSRVTIKAWGGGSSYTGSGTDVLNMAGNSTGAGNNTDEHYADNAGQGGAGGVNPSLGAAGTDGRIVVLVFPPPGTMFLFR